MNKFTAGPYSVDHDKTIIDTDSQFSVKAASGLYLATVLISGTDSETEEEARATTTLLAAAPDLIEALIAMNAQLEADGYMGTTYGPLRLAATKAIAKALA